MPLVGFYLKTNRTHFQKRCVKNWPLNNITPGPLVRKQLKAGEDVERAPAISNRATSIETDKKKVLGF
jgi:hypothetical protein